MKKLLWFLILIAITNISYASFPLNDTLILYQDTLKSETTLEYHQRMKAMGFDISNCLCTDCRKFKGESINFKKTSSNEKKMATTLRNIGGFLLTCILIIVFILLFLIIKSVSDWLDAGAPFL